MTVPKTPNCETLENLRRTIEQSLVSIVFQPIAGIEQTGIMAYEALTRPAPESGFQYPDQLFDAAEEHDLIWELECVTRRKSLEAAAGWSAGKQLFLNSTPQVIADTRFTETILAEIAEIDGLSPTRIVLEVTERSENRHVEGLQLQTAALQKHGFKIAIDDVGAGTSGLNRIMLLRPQWLKLDRALVTNIDQDPVRTNLIRFLTHFARLSGVSIVAEGVERIEEFERVMQLGVDAVQGYLLGRPGTADQSIPDELVAAMTDQSGSKNCPVFQRDRADSIGMLAHPVITAGLGDSVASVQEALRHNTRAPGVVAEADGMPTGWCTRERVLDASIDGATLVADIATPFARTLDASDRIDLALENAASVEAADLDSPIAVTQNALTVGVVRVRDLLRAGSELCRVVRQRSATLTGLPGRVRCEQQLLRAFREDANREVAFIDIRKLTEYNAIFGFELGDQLITNLVEVIEESARDLVGLDTDAAFLGHLGDDRLMLITDSGFGRRIARPAIEMFESRVAASGISPQAALSGVGGAPAVAGVSLRFLIVPAIKAVFSTPQEVMQTESVLRAMADEQAAIDPTRTGYIVVAPTDTPGESLLLAA